jgi:hypothetical protein
MEADGMLVQKQYATAFETFKAIIDISEAKRDFTPDDFNWQLLTLIRLQRVYKSLGAPVPVPLEKLVRYYEIVSRNHPKGETFQLGREEAMICAKVLQWLPSVGADNSIAHADPVREKELINGIQHLLEQNKDKYKLGVFYKKGF